MTGGRRAHRAPAAGEARSANAPDATLRAAVKGVAITAIGLTLAVLLSFGVRPAIGVGVGGALATANLLFFSRMSEAFLARRGTVPWGILGVVKLVLLLGLVWLLIRNELVGAGWLALGYASLPIGITLGSLFGPKPPESSPPEGTGAAGADDGIGEQSPSFPEDDDDRLPFGAEVDPLGIKDVVDGKPRKPNDSSGDR